MAEQIRKSKVPIFKVGTHIPSDGKPITITDADLDGMIKNFNGDLAAGYRPPVVLGHPKMDDPRYGDLLALQKEGGALYADFGVIPELDTQLKKGQYPDRSIRIARMTSDGTYRIKHLGLLGVIPPAVEGLPAYQFSESDPTEDVTIDFTAGKMGGMKDKMKAMYERMKTVLSDMSEMMGGATETNTDMAVEEGPAREFTKKEDEMGDVEKLKQQLAEATGKIADFAKSDEASKARIRALEAEGRQRDFATFCEGLQKEGKLSPAMKPAVMDFMEILSGVETFDFAEGEGKKAAAPVEKFKALLGTYPKIIEFSETATKDKGAGDQGKGTAGEKLHAFAEEKMKANDSLTYSAAFSAAQSEHQDLAIEYAAEIRG